MSYDKSDETKLHRLLREARARRDAYHSELEAASVDRPVDVRLAPVEQSEHVDATESVSPVDVEDPGPPVNVESLPDEPAVESSNELVSVRADLESVPFAVGSDGDVARAVADTPPTYQPLEPEVDEASAAPDDLDDLAEPAVAPELTAEELAQQERDRQFRSGEWQNIYGLDINQVAMEIASRPQRRSRRDPLDSGEWEHAKGAAWHELPVPRKWHRCRADSTKRSGDGFKVIERCACGAVRVTEMGSQGDWDGRNSRSEEIEAGRAAAGDAAQRR